MSNPNKPTLTLPGAGAPPPPPVPPPPPAHKFTAILERFPPPWRVGPYGDIWVAADVEPAEPDANGPGVMNDGKGKWRATGDKARLVMENPTGEDIAALIVHAVNSLAK